MYRGPGSSHHFAHQQGSPCFPSAPAYIASPPLKRPSLHSRAFKAIRVLSAIERPPLSPHRMGLLVTGLQLVCCWRYMAALVEGFESRGLNCIWEIWVTAVIAFIVGQIVKYFTPARHEAQLDEELDLVLPEHGVMHGKLHPLKEGQELTVPLDQPAAAGKGAQLMHVQQEDGEDDMATMKRRAQEEAAAKLAKYRAEVQELLASIRKEASSSALSTPVDAQLLYRLADQLFASSINVSEFVELGGVPVVVEAVRANTRCLTAARRRKQQEIEEEPQPQQESREAAVLPSMLQASWVLLQLSQGPPACRAALQDPQCSSALLAAAQAVSALPPVAARATEPVLRNLLWTLLSMCDRPVRGPRASSQHSAGSQQQQARDQTSFQQQLLQQYQDHGAVPMLQQLVTLRHGLSAGWVAAAHLGLLMQLGHHNRQQQQQQDQHEQVDQGADDSCAVLAALAAAAVQAVLQEESVTGLCYLMTHLRFEQPPTPQEQQQQQLSGRMRVLVEGMLHYVLTFHSRQLLQMLLELQLLGAFAAHSCPRLARLLVCQLLSSKGQEVMAAVEEGYELDVPLGLAQIIPLKVHVKVPACAPAQQGTSAAGAEPAGAGAQDTPALQQQQQQSEQQQPADDMYTDILACRLLLQHERLGELLSAFCEELQAPPDPQQQQRQQLAASNPVAAAADAAARECSVVTAGLALVQHLMSRDLQLQAAKHVRGDCVSDTLSGTTSSSRSLEDALAMPDHSGTYSKVMAGMVPAERLPAGSPSASSSSASDLFLPAAQASAGSHASTVCGKQVVFRFGEQRHAVDAAIFKQLRQCSKLVSSILGRMRGEQEPITVLAIPQFTDEANCWVLQCLEGWLSTKALDGFSVLQAAKLWVAADFLQVDDLQVACEDLIAAGFRSDPQQHMPVALELCARHLDSGGRLLRLLVQQLLQSVSSACSSGASTQGQDTAQMGLLRQLLEQHTGVLLPMIHAELRDRLVTLCMLNAGTDAEDPSDVVG